MQGFDVIVVGGGHAGTEAAAAAARMGARCGLITQKISQIGEMSCNPAIGGLGKGHLVREIDALGGVMGLAADRSGIQFRLLNRKKGPAVQGPRAQIDRQAYRSAVQNILKTYQTLQVIEGCVEEILFEDNRVCGARLEDGTVLSCGGLVVTTGTFLNGVIHRGDERISAGRIGDSPSVGLAVCLQSLGLPLGRLKTGTPARLDAGSIDFSCLELQPGDDVPCLFSVLSRSPSLAQVSCAITETNACTHDIIRNALHLSAQYSGQISSSGPRYCPSIEDKIVRFADRSSHQVFLEPEGLEDDTIYPNGLSTSLPEAVQLDFLRSMKGLEQVCVKQFGYAIEYDYMDPRGLDHRLAVKGFEGLFFAGQINGTTGYEEAGAQGLLAGVNAVCFVRSEAPLILKRSEAYLGVLVDDLVRLGVSEPYRMFTSRAEYRLSLRVDNADLRLTPVGQSFGLVSNRQFELFNRRNDAITSLRSELEARVYSPNVYQNAGIQVNQDGRKRSLFQVLSMPHVTLDDLDSLIDISSYDLPVREFIAVEAAYDVYLKRQNDEIKLFEQENDIKLSAQVDYTQVSGLSRELRDKLQRIQPQTLAEARQIEGMTPSVLALLVMIHRPSDSAA